MASACSCCCRPVEPATRPGRARLRCHCKCRYIAAFVSKRGRAAVLAAYLLAGTALLACAPSCAEAARLVHARSSWLPRVDHSGDTKAVVADSVDLDGQGVVTSNASGATPASWRRGLKQLLPNYDPYGYAFYDPYVAGVTPGFVNVDLNRETGLHVGVGDVAVDVSSDKNYYGLGIGQWLGIGAARDRGWNVQVGAGNVMDLSLTKDAGLGLWLLDGLVNVNIGPSGGGTAGGVYTARSDGAVEPAPEVTAVVVDDAAVRAAGGVTEVVVDDVTATAWDHPGMPSAAMAAPDAFATYDDSLVTDVTPVGVAAASPVAPASGMGTAWPPEVLAQLAAAQAAAAAAGPPPGWNGGSNGGGSQDMFESLEYETYGELPQSATSVARLRQAAPSVVQTPRQQQQQQQQQQRPATTQNAAASPATSMGSFLVSRPATQELPPSEEDAVWSTASQYSDTERTASALAAARAGTRSGVDTVLTASPQQLAQTAHSPSPRRACEGGEAVWVSGDKYKCRYRRTAAQSPSTASSGQGLVSHVAPALVTYPNGVAARR